MWEVAEKVGITERGVHKLVAELIQEGYLTRCKGWRRNRYEVPTHLPLRHPLEAHRPVQALLSLLDEDLPGAKAAETG